MVFEREAGYELLGSGKDKRLLIYATPDRAGYEQMTFCSVVNYGVSLLNNCKYGHSVKDNVMKLTLLKSSKYPDTEADMGEHTFTYALYPHTGGVVCGGTIEQANRLNLPAVVVPGETAENRRIIRVSDSSVVIDAVKKAEDENCLVVRFHECRGGRETVTIASDFPVKKIVPCNLLERDLGDPIWDNQITCEFSPFEIKTWKLYL